MNELRACPCCGSPEDGARLIEQGHVNNCAGRATKHRVVCLDCGLTIPEYDTKEQAAAAWNRRAEKVVCHTCELYNTPSYKYYTYPCSECKHRARDSYSPNCGARMEETNDAKRAEESERVKHTIEKGKADG